MIDEQPKHSVCFQQVTIENHFVDVNKTVETLQNDDAITKMQAWSMLKDK